MSKKKIFTEEMLKETQKRFKKLYEYSFNTLEEDGEEDDFQDSNSQGVPGVPDANGNNNGPSMSGEHGMNDTNTPDEGDIPNTDGSQDMGMDNSDPSIGGEPGMEGNQDMGMDDSDPSANTSGAPGFNPQENDGEGVPDDAGFDEEESDDEVIDVDDLTDSQEKTEEKVDDLGDLVDEKFKKLLKVVDKVEKMIDNNNSNIENFKNDIKQEIEKRNPTPVEKLSMRAANDSYPFNVSPDQYWTEKEKTSNYSREDDNDGEGEMQYQITRNDIDSNTDFSGISKEIDDLSQYNNLRNVFGM